MYSAKISLEVISNWVNFINFLRIYILLLRPVIVSPNAQPDDINFILLPWEDLQNEVDNMLEGISECHPENYQCWFNGTQRNDGPSSLPFKDKSCS